MTHTQKKKERKLACAWGASKNRTHTKIEYYPEDHPIGPKPEPLPPAAVLRPFPAAVIKI